MGILTDVYYGFITKKLVNFCNKNETLLIIYFSIFSYNSLNFLMNRR